MKYLRDVLLGRSKVFVACYAFYIRAWAHCFVYKEDECEVLRSCTLRDLVESSIADGKLSWEVVKRIHSNVYDIPLLPKKLLQKEWNIFGKKIGPCVFRWNIEIIKHEGKGLWQHIDIELGRWFEVVTRWEDGHRKYVILRLWRKPFSSFSPLSHFVQLYGTFEFSHELWHINNRYPVSRWRWGRGWLLPNCYLLHPEDLYHHFGKLFRLTWQNRRYGWLGTELSPEDKEKVYYEEYKPTLQGCRRGAAAQTYLDAITGYVRNAYKEFYWACCTDCKLRMRPEGECVSEILRCQKCNEKKEQALAA